MSLSLVGCPLWELAEQLEFKRVKRGGSAIACSTQSPGYMSMHLQRRTLKHTDPDSLNQLFRFAACVRLYFSGTVNLLVKTTRKEKIVNNACSITFRMKLDRIWFFFCLTEFRFCPFFSHGFLLLFRLFHLYHRYKGLYKQSSAHDTQSVTSTPYYTDYTARAINDKLIEYNRLWCLIYSLLKREIIIFPQIKVMGTSLPYNLGTQECLRNIE